MDKLKEVMINILPLVDTTADALGILLLVSVAAIAWIFYYCFQIFHLSLGISSAIAICALLPSLILLRIWYALICLQDIPNLAKDLVDDVSSDVAQGWHARKSGKKGALNIFSQAKRLFQIRSLISSAKDVFEEYFKIGPLINPLSLFFAVISLISVLLMISSSIVLGVIALL